MPDRGDDRAADERGLEAVDGGLRGATPSAIASFVQSFAIVDSAATPTAPPICCDVLIRPDASPASSGSTPASAAIVIGTNPNGIPGPISEEAGQEVDDVRPVDRDLRVPEQPERHRRPSR